MRPIKEIRTAIRDAFHSINEVETQYYQQALDDSQEWGKRFGAGLSKQDDESFRTSVFVLKYATLALKAVTEVLKQANFVARIENCFVDPDTGALYDWRIATLNEIRAEAHRSIVDRTYTLTNKITVRDLSTLED